MLLGPSRTVNQRDTDGAYSDDEDELALLPVDQRAAARSAKVIRRYVPSVAPERTRCGPLRYLRTQHAYKNGWAG